MAGSCPSVADLARFLRTNDGREEFAELVIGAISEMPVRVVKDDVCSDRLSLRAAGGGSLVEFTLKGDSAKEFIEAVEQASAEFEW